VNVDKQEVEVLKRARENFVRRDRVFTRMAKVLAASARRSPWSVS
jgi:hypothetical protein